MEKTEKKIIKNLIYLVEDELKRELTKEEKIQILIGLYCNIYLFSFKFISFFYLFLFNYFYFIISFGYFNWGYCLFRNRLWAVV